MAKPKTAQKPRTTTKTTRKSAPSAARKPAQSAKRKSSTGRKRKSNKAPALSILKYEIYGIILITLSVIALSRQAAVGHFLYYITAFILGKVYFVLPLVGMYIGLMTMLRQRWNHGWNSRMSGLVLLVFTMTLGSVMLHVPAEQLSSLPARQEAGGYIGAVQTWMLTMLFGVIGTKLIAGVMLMISLMLITQKSVVEVADYGRNILSGAGAAVGRQWQSSREAVAERRRERELELAEAEELAAQEPETYEEEYEEGQARQGLLGWLRKSRANQEEEETEAEETVYAALPERSTTPSRRRSKSKTSLPAEDSVVASTSAQPRSMYIADEDDLWDNAPATGTLAAKAGDTVGSAEAVAAYTEGVERDAVPDRTPIIRDFFEQIRSERSDQPEREYGESDEVSSTDSIHDYPLVDSYSEHTDQDQIPSDVISDSISSESAHLASNLEGAVESAQNDANIASSSDASAAAEGDQQAATPPPPPPKPYRLPPYSLLAKPKVSSNAADQNDYMVIARKLETTLESFGVRAKVLEVVRGPAVTRYEIQPDVGVKVSRIVGLTDDIALALAAKDIRMEAPIPGKSAIGIEVPNNEVAMVTMREVMETQIFNDSEAKLSIAFGRDIAGQTIIGNLAKMPHLLVAGATGSGKSVCINGIITSILYKAKPDEVKFLMVDPKMVELNIYNGIPHLLAPVVTDPRRASLALKKIVVEMEKRYDLFSKSGTRNMEGYNNLMKDNPDAILPYIVVIVDELADLMMVAAGDVEDAIARLAQMARAAGIHLIIATQRPSVDVITGVIKANIPSRIAFGVSSQIDSRTILDMGGAEKLLGRGDMLFMPMGASKPVRVQGAFMSDQEVETIVDYCRSQGEAQYNEDIVPEIDDSAAAMDEQKDELFDQAVQIVVEAKQASVSLLQRRMRVGYTRAARLIDSLEAHGIVGPYEGSKPREVLVSPEQYHQIGTGS
ncbi:FtsK/SpoIIIE family DNA translocase [Paenibacillus kandeliae]|uniref:FtsK/SpoIIIE family DNA translocase n=1 Tax=Paenibacillus kandeliae TaxID=3231269 RepID=UPI0034590D87